MSRTEIDCDHEQLRCAKAVGKPRLATTLCIRKTCGDMLCEESDNAPGNFIASLIIHCQSSSRMKIVVNCPAWGLLNRAYSSVCTT